MKDYQYQQLPTLETRRAWWPYALAFAVACSAAVAFWPGHILPAGTITAQKEAEDVAADAAQAIVDAKATRYMRDKALAAAYQRGRRDAMKSVLCGE